LTEKTNGLNDAATFIELHLEAQAVVSSTHIQPPMYFRFLNLHANKLSNATVAFM